jgi:single-strand DNA-binding protein
MANLNKVQIIGALGRDPELKWTQGGQAVCKLNVATSRQWTNKQTNQREEETEWHRVVIWGRQAENCDKYLAKGKQVYVEGRLKTSSYDKDGQKHYTTEIIAETVQFLGGVKDGTKREGGSTALVQNEEAVSDDVYASYDSGVDDGIPF